MEPNNLGQMHGSLGMDRQFGGPVIIAPFPVSEANPPTDHERTFTGSQSTGSVNPADYLEATVLDVCIFFGYSHLFQSFAV